MIHYTTFKYLYPQSYLLIIRYFQTSHCILTCSLLYTVLLTILSSYNKSYRINTIVNYLGKKNQIILNLILIIVFITNFDSNSTKDNTHLIGAMGNTHRPIKGHFSVPPIICHISLKLGKQLTSKFDTSLNYNYLTYIYAISPIHSKNFAALLSPALLPLLPLQKYPYSHTPSQSLVAK